MFPHLLYAEQLEFIETQDVKIYFEEPLRFAAQELMGIYPITRTELEQTLYWNVDFKPTILLINDRDAFHRMSGSKLFVAYALPQKNLMVIDYSQMNIHPFTLGVTLKHELCHLLLHHYITKTNLPRWLDEGVSQWVSGGIAEIITGKRESALTWATITGNYISLSALSINFPDNENALFLAYEESKSIVEYINATYGKNGILNILTALKNGNDIDKATKIAFSLSLGELEMRWKTDLRSLTIWLSYLAGNIYAILFFLAALLTIIGYIRILIKKKKRLEEQEEDDVFNE